MPFTYGVPYHFTGGVPYFALWPLPPILGHPLPVTIHGDPLLYVVARLPLPVWIGGTFHRFAIPFTYRVPFSHHFVGGGPFTFSLATTGHFGHPYLYTWVGDPAYLPLPG